MARDRILGITAAAGAALMLMGAGQPAGWLSLCSKCMSPTITASSGLGAANATAEARITREEAQGWCENWSPGRPECLREQMASEEYRTIFKASADCTRGTISPIQGGTYRLAGVWDASDIGAGRSKWRDASGQIVGRDNASNGLAISQQWEVLCPKGLVRASAPAPGPAAAARPAPVAGAAYAVGQAIEARYMSAWVRGRVVKLRPTGGGIDYEVVLENGQRGILPPRMLRPVTR